MNICVFGDSIAKGVVYDEAKGKYIFSRRGFTDLIAADTGASVRNYSRFGCTTSKGLEIVRRHSGELASFDYVILEFGGNDCDLDWKAAAEHPEIPQTGQVPKEDFVKNYIQLIEIVRSSGGKAVLTSLPPLDPERFFSWVTEDPDRFSVMRFLKNDKSNIYRWQEEYNDMIFQIGDMTDTPVLDIRRPFLESGSYAELLCKDGMHPNEDGHKAIADFLEYEWLGLAKKTSNIISWDDLLPFEYGFSGPDVLIPA